VTALFLGYEPSREGMRQHPGTGPCCRSASVKAAYRYAGNAEDGTASHDTSNTAFSHTQSTITSTAAVPLTVEVMELTYLGAGMLPSLMLLPRKRSSHIPSVAPAQYFTS